MSQQRLGKVQKTFLLFLRENGGHVHIFTPSALGLARKLQTKGYLRSRKCASSVPYNHAFDLTSRGLSVSERVSPRIISNEE